MRVPTRRADKIPKEFFDPNITQNKYDQLKRKLDDLLHIQRPKLSLEVQRLAEMGDFSENAAYQTAKWKLRGVNRRIDDIEDRLKYANIIYNNVDGTVSIGSTVSIENLGQIKIYKILGSTETNPTKGIISHNSPLGQALLDHAVGDIIKIPSILKEYKIISID